jgi:glycosyltransferase involved in cell wall biosynthesis
MSALVCGSYQAQYHLGKIFPARARSAFNIGAQHMTISVYITSYNQRAYLQEAIESVLAQTLRPDQIIVVDDCSADDSPELIRGYAARYPGLFTTIFHAQNTGVAQARIDALNAVTGDYVTFLDGDDCFFPGKLEHEMAALRAHPDAAIAFSNVVFTDGAGNRLGLWIEDARPPQGDVFVAVVGRHFPRGMVFRSELVHYSAWRAIGFHDPAMGWLEDWDMRVRLTRRCRAVYADTLGSTFRRHGQGLSDASVTFRLAAAEYSFRKNKPLLDDLSPGERRRAISGARQWLAELSRQAAQVTLDGGDRRGALRYYWSALRNQPRRFDRRFALRLLLPSQMVGALRSAE